MPRRDPFRQHRFPKDVILLSVRRPPPNPQPYDVRDLLAAGGITVDAATLYRWVQKFGPQIRKRASGQHRSRRNLQWHVDETYVRVTGKWCYLRRAVDHLGPLIDFRLTARRNASAARTFMRQAGDTVRCYHPMTIVTDKAHSHAEMIEAMNFGNGPDDRIRHVGRKPITPPGNNFCAQNEAFENSPVQRTPLKGIETRRAVKKGHPVERQWPQETRKISLI